MSRPAHIFTIGYEGASLADFIALLKISLIEELVDIRQRASSRRAGFSKTPLCTALRAAGIDYRHVRSLGTPVALRHELAAHRDYHRFFSRFADYLATRAEDVELLGQSLNGNMVLMCFERDSRYCHRSLVAAALSKITGAPVTHLEVLHD